MSLTIRAEFNQLPINKESQLHVIATLRGEAAVDATAAPRKPIHLALVIDTSSSMGGAKIEQTQRAMHEVVAMLTRRDSIALIAYSTAARLIMPLTALTDKATVAARINEFRSGGWTNLSDGWLMGISQLDTPASNDCVRRVILLTDGQVNKGIVDPAKLAEIAARTRATGLATTAFGFGSGFNEQLLKSLAENGGGNFQFINLPEDAGNAFRQEFGDINALVGQNLELRVAPAPHVSIVEDLSPVASRIEGRARIYRLGDLIDGAMHRLVLRLRVEATGAHPGAVPLELSGTWLDVNTLAPVTAQTSWQPEFHDLAGAGKIDHEVLDEVILAKCAEAKNLAVAAANAGQLDDARRLIDSRLEVIEERLRSGGDFANTGLLQAESTQLRFVRDAIDKHDVDVGKHVAQQQADLRGLRGTYIKGRERKYAVQTSFAAGDRDRQKDAVAEVAQRLTDLGLAADFQKRCLLCLTELVANAVDHGCAGNPDGNIEVEAVFRRASATITVADRGSGFDADTMIARARQVNADNATSKVPSPTSVYCKLGTTGDAPAGTNHSGKPGDPNIDLVATRGRGLMLILANSDDLQYSESGRVATVRLSATPAAGVLSLDSVSVGANGERKVSAEIRVHPVPGRAGKITELLLNGDLDMWSLSGGKQAVQEVLNRGGTDVVLNLENLSYIDSAGVGFFVGTKKIIADAGGRLVMVNVNAYLTQIFRLIQLEHIIPMFDDLQGAGQWFANQSA